MNRQARIAYASQLKFRIVHCSDMTGRFGSTTAPEIGGQTMTALTER
jgi:hypothetical protein